MGSHDSSSVSLLYLSILEFENVVKEDFLQIIETIFWIWHQTSVPVTLFLCLSPILELVSEGSS